MLFNRQFVNKTRSQKVFSRAALATPAAKNVRGNKMQTLEKNYMYSQSQNYSAIVDESVSEPAEQDMKN